MAKAKPDSISYQELHEELESVIAQLQREDIDVDQALERYTRGLALVKQLEAYLQTAENRVRQLRAEFDRDKA